MERASRSLHTARRGGSGGIQAQWPALAGSFEAARFPAANEGCVEVTDWLLRQLMGEKYILPDAEGRQIVKMGIGQYQAKRTAGTDIREAIIEILTDFGELSTGQLFDELQLQGWQADYSSAYSILKKMEKHQVIIKRIQASAHGGKGVAIWQMK